MKGIDRKGWKRVSFGEVCRSLNVTERSPLEAGIERYVGLEHIEPENLHIKTWGSVAEGTTFTKRFEPGHVLFGKRRAYQKKAAVADFTGICSGDILVLEAIEDVIDPRLLPFVVQADRFFEHAVQTSAGSLSPRTKFQDLAKYSFLLPSRDEQERLAELFWAGDKAIEECTTLLHAHQNIVDILFLGVYSQSTLKNLLLGECLLFSQYGTSEQLNDVGEIPVLRMNNLHGKKVVLSDLKYIRRDVIPNIERLLLKKGDILFNRTNSYELVGKVGMFHSDESEVTFASYLVRLRVNEQVVLPEYLNAFMNSLDGQSAIKKYRTPSVSQSNINVENLKKVVVPVVPIDSQREMVGKLLAVEIAIEKIKNRKDNFDTIQKRITNQVFSD